MKMSEKTEEQGIEVFGTKEVSVKEFMGGTDKSLMLLSNYELAKENLEALKLKYKPRVSELVAIDKLSPAELKELGVIRGKLREPRYLVDKIQKNNISAFETYKKTDKANLKTLVDILKSTEDEADGKIKLEEDRKKNEKAEEARLEQLRIDTIKGKIDEFETSSYKIIQETKFADIDANQIKLQALESADFDYEEYDILFDQAKSRVENQWNAKVLDLKEKENQRLDNIRLEEEAKEQKRLSDLQGERLNQIMPYVAFGEAVDLIKLSELDIDSFDKVLSSKKALFEADAKKKKEDEEAAAVKLKEENDQVYEIRSNRLAEIGFSKTFPDNEFDAVFSHESLFSWISWESVYECSALEFEKMLADAKKGIANSEKEAKELDEKEEVKEKETESRISKLLEIGLNHSDEHGTYFVASDSDWMVLPEDVSDATPEAFEEMLSEAKQAISDYKKSKEDAEALKKENKARIKRLAPDKKAISGSLYKIGELVYSEISSDKFENEETESFRQIIDTKFAVLIENLLTDLEKL